MIDYTQVREEGRMKIAVIRQQEIEGYMLISKLPDTRTLDLFDLPEHWVISGVAYEIRRQAFVFVVLSPEFEKTPLGQEPETLQRTRHTIEITRRAVSA